MSTKSFKTIASAILACGLFSSCVATDVVTPEANKDSSEYVVLNVSSPQEATRADEGYKLRYIAKIFQGSSRTAWGDPLDRQELIDGENGNQIVFKVDPNDNYAILVFADYIPANYEAGADGLYNDYFYNTKKNSKQVVLRTTPGSDAANVSSSFFNNHNYDAFFGMETFRKEEAEKVVDMTLKRTTAQVVFREKSENEGECSVSVNKLGVRKSFSQDQNNSADPDFYEANKSLGNLNLTETANVDSSNKDLFFFYTLADPTSSPQNVSTEFKVTKNETESDVITVKDIPVKANYKTIVTGEFLPADNSGDDPKEEDPTKSGDVILNLTTDFSWQQEPLSK